MLYGRALLRSGDAPVAERVLQQAAEQMPVQRAVFLDLADAAEQLGHDTLALDALHRYVALGDGDASDTTVAGHLARLQHQTLTP